jgi:hypothetical protein
MSAGTMERYSTMMRSPCERSGGVGARRRNIQERRDHAGQGYHGQHAEALFLRALRDHRLLAEELEHVGKRLVPRRADAVLKPRVDLPVQKFQAQPVGREEQQARKQENLYQCGHPRFPPESFSFCSVNAISAPRLRYHSTP